MSISVKNISVSINGTVSNQFNIQLDGVKYTLDKFKMSQKLLEPCKLEFLLRKTPEEDITEIQFTTCGSIIGKEVKLTLQTGSMEQEIQGFSQGSQNADIEFEGWVTSAKGIRKETEYVIKVVAETKEVILKDSPDYMYYNEMKLESIVTFVAKNRGGIDVEVNTKSSDPIFYTAQYRETSYQFLQRLAQRYGEWMFNNGKKFHFGKFNKQETVTLAYPSKDLEYYSANLQTYRVANHLFMPQGYNDTTNYVEDYDEGNVDLGSRLNDITYHAWQDKSDYWTTDDATAQGIEQDDKVKVSYYAEKMDYDFFNDAYISYVFGRRSNMLVYEGKSFCSKLEIGAKLTIKDNYISNDSSQQKSEVQQDEILITEVIHSFTADEQYENRFKGIATEADYPPYLDPTVYPVCNHPIRAVVKDNEDPKHWGRVRVRFQGPSSKIAAVVGKTNDDKDIYEDPRSWTPWLKVSQPYSGPSGDAEDNTIYGSHWLPERGGQVLVDFEGGNFERPFVCGALVTSGFSRDDSKWYIGDNNVKAIRTASGHTIEIHDNQNKKYLEDGGFIKIYDNHTHAYELLLSTDRSLIKLTSVGDIELDAGQDIYMHAKRDVIINCDRDFSQYADGTAEFYSEKKMDIGTDDTMDIHSKKDMTITTKEIATVASDKDMHITCHKDRHDHIDGTYHTEIKKNYTIKAFENVGFDVTKKFLARGDSVHLQAMDFFQQYAKTYCVNSTMDINLTATKSIDLNAPMINES